MRRSRVRLLPPAPTTRSARSSAYEAAAHPRSDDRSAARRLPGRAGHPQLRTPNIDRIAMEGIRFAQATTVSPICMSARASFASGLYPHNHGVWANQGELPAADETFFQLLQRAGYYTAQVGKTHFYDHRAGLDMRAREPYLHARGFEYVHETPGPIAACATISHMTTEWAAKGLLAAFVDDYRARTRSGNGDVWPSPLPVEDVLDSYVGRKAVEFIDGYADPRPMFLFVGLRRTARTVGCALAACSDVPRRRDAETDPHSRRQRGAAGGRKSEARFRDVSSGATRQHPEHPGELLRQDFPHRRSRRPDTGRAPAKGMAR